METAFYISSYVITAFAAVALLGIGIFSLCRRETSSKAAVTAVLSFGFLALLLLNMSKFKHVKGFGFEAETWDQKQVEAAKLVDQLSSTSEALSQQVALLASRLGIFGASLTNLQLLDLLQQTEKILEAASIPKARRDELLLPIRQRIAYNYWEKAYRNVAEIYDHQAVSLSHQGDQNKATELRNEENELQKLDASVRDMPRSLEPLISVVKASKVFKLTTDLLQELTDLNEDLLYFRANDGNELRRKIDLDVAYPFPSP
jgi:hypothetical protein